MNIFQKLGEKSWQPQPAGIAPEVLPQVEGKTPANTALSFFIAIVSVIFFLFAITFITRTTLPDFQSLAGEPWQPFTQPAQLWINTLMLLFSGLGLHFAKRKSEKGQQRQAMLGLFAAALLAIGFLLGQILVWQELQALGYFMRTHPAASYFYLFTAIHGLHLAGGLGALFLVLIQFFRKQQPERLSAGLRLCTRYWDFLFIVWLLLFGLLTASPETYRTIAELCGF